MAGRRLQRGKGKGKDWVEKVLGLTAEDLVRPPRGVGCGYPRGPGYAATSGFHGPALRRWVVERTFSWIGQNRRMSKDYERLPESSSEAFVYVAR